MVYGLSTSLEIVFWMLLFSLLIGLARVLREHQGFGFSVSRVWQEMLSPADQGKKP
jgi:hypothetical protein